MISNRQRRIAVSVPPLKGFLERVRAELHFPPNSVSVRFVSDSQMSRLNQAYRRKSGPTDILSFPARNGRHPGEAGYLGDIVISPETAQRNARRASHPLQVELRVLILHGMLHLAGYDHESDDGEMNRLERKLRKRLVIR